MFGRRKDAPSRIDTLIGKAAKLTGDIEFAGGLHLDGRVVGNIRGTGDGKCSLSVSEHGVVEGSVDSLVVVLNGTVNGDIFARERVVLGSQARVNGNVSYGVIEMAPGATITGKLMPLAAGKPARSEADLERSPAALVAVGESAKPA